MRFCETPVAWLSPDATIEKWREIFATKLKRWTVNAVSRTQIRANAPSCGQTPKRCSSSTTHRLKIKTFVRPRTNQERLFQRLVSGMPMLDDVGKTSVRLTPRRRSSGKLVCIHEALSRSELARSPLMGTQSVMSGNQVRSSSTNASRWLSAASHNES